VSGSFQPSVDGLPGGVEQLRDPGHRQPFLDELPEKSSDAGVQPQCATPCKQL